MPAPEMTYHSVAPLVHWRKFGDELPAFAKGESADHCRLLVIRASFPERIDAGHYYADTNECFLGEDFRVMQTDDLWTYARDLLPRK